MNNPNTRPTMQMIDAKIKSVTYTRLPAGPAIVCEIQLMNLHLCHGIAVVCDMDNDDPDQGKQAAYDKAIAQVFDYVTYDLHERMTYLGGTGTEVHIPNQNDAIQILHQVANNNQPILL